jgi:raffinose synthase
VQTFIVWHAFQGYWSGVDPEAFPQYRVQQVTENYSPGIRSYRTDEENAASTVAGVVAPEEIYRFYQEYHRHLYRQGVDGVKVDNQSSSESSVEGLGGRVRVLRMYHEALEGSVQRYFLGNLINCMSCGTDIIYQLLNSTLLRTSDDFWPKKPATHGLHLYTNAFVSFFAGEFVHPDWDMFQSGHAMGAFHAAARAISGGPVYVSDKPEAHDFALLRKLVLADGSVLRCRDIARPTRDCLFTNPTREDVLLKVFNRNLDAGVVGVFNARYHEEEAERQTISGQVRPADVEGLAEESFAVYAHNAQALTCCTREEAVTVTLPEGGFELFTIVPIDNGMAPIGLTDKFNSAGAIAAKGFDAAGRYTITVRDGGPFLACCAQQPTTVLVDGQSVPYDYNTGTGALTVMLTLGTPHTVVLM